MPDFIHYCTSFFIFVPLLPFCFCVCPSCLHSFSLFLSMSVIFHTHSKAGLPDGTYIFVPKIPTSEGLGKSNFGKFYGSFVYLWSFGVACGHLVYFVVFWYISPRFGMLHQKDLATLLKRTKQIESTPIVLNKKAVTVNWDTFITERKLRTRRKKSEAEVIENIKCFVGVPSMLQICCTFLQHPADRSRYRITNGDTKFFILKLPIPYVGVCVTHFYVRKKQSTLLQTFSANKTTFSALKFCDQHQRESTPNLSI
jgi:hypothetical protein